MFSAKKRKAGKEVPKWKLDQMRAEDEDLNPPSKAAKPDASAEEDASASDARKSRDSAAGSSKERTKLSVGSSSAAGGATDDGGEEDDDDDEGFDPRNYGASSEEEEEGGGELSHEELSRCCVHLFGLAPGTTASEIRTLFEPCGPVIHVRRVPDVFVDTTAFVAFAHARAARKALDRSGEVLKSSKLEREQTLQIRPAAEPAPPTGVAPIDTLGGSREEQLIELGLIVPPPPPPKQGTFVTMPGMGHMVAGASGRKERPHGGGVFMSKDHDLVRGYKSQPFIPPPMPPPVQQTAPHMQPPPPHYHQQPPPAHYSQPPPPQPPPGWQ